jgi:hypothetical protein
MGIFWRLVTREERLRLRPRKTSERRMSDPLELVSDESFSSSSFWEKSWCLGAGCLADRRGGSWGLKRRFLRFPLIWESESESSSLDVSCSCKFRRDCLTGRPLDRVRPWDGRPRRAWVVWVSGTSSSSLPDEEMLTVVMSTKPSSVVLVLLVRSCISSPSADVDEVSSY